MDTETLRALVEVVVQLSTMLFVVLFLSLAAGHILATLFSLDLLGIMLAALVRRYAEQHQAIRPMALALGRQAPFHRVDRNAVYATFLRGMEASGIDPVVPVRSVT